MMRILIQFFFLILVLNQFALAQRPWLGFTFLQRGSYPCSLQVESLHPKSGALQAGLQKGDIVTLVDGSPLRGMADLQERMGKATVGQVLQLSVIRAGQVKKIPVKLTARPDDIRAFTGSHVGSKAYPLGKSFYANQSKVKPKPKVILLDFWATWCGPCRASIPMLKEMYNEFSGQGFELIGLSNEVESVLKDFQNMEKVPWPLYRDIGNQQGGHWGVRAVPTLILLDENWVVLKVWEGPPAKSQLRQLIKAQLP